MSDAAAASARFPARDAGFLLAYALTSVIFICNHLAGFYPAIGLFIGFVIVPIVDYTFGVDAGNFDTAAEQEVSSRKIYAFLLYAWAPVQVTLITYGCWRFATHDVPLWAWPLLFVSAGIPTGAIGITIAHELGHRGGRLDQLLTRVLLACACYTHFTIEHNRGHHIHVATPRDPATSRLGESFWFFFARTVPQQWLSAWRIENKLVRDKTGSALSIRNRMIWFTLLPLVIGGCLYALWGPKAALFFYGQAFVAFGLLESVNYLEHYGLQRREIEPGVYERVTPLHSWNASYYVSNWLLFKLQRHADHHAYAARRYQILRHLPEGPQLPAGYPTMIPLTLITPLWRRIMDHRAIAARKAAGSWTAEDEAKFGHLARPPA